MTLIPSELIEKIEKIDKKKLGLLTKIGIAFVVFLSAICAILSGIITISAKDSNK